MKVEDINNPHTTFSYPWKIFADGVHATIAEANKFIDEEMKKRTALFEKKNTEQEDHIKFLEAVRVAQGEKIKELEKDNHRLEVLSCERVAKSVIDCEKIKRLSADPINFPIGGHVSKCTPVLSSKEKELSDELEKAEKLNKTLQGVVDLFVKRNLR